MLLAPLLETRPVGEIGKPGKKVHSLFFQRLPEPNAGTKITAR